MMVQFLIDLSVSLHCLLVEGVGVENSRLLIHHLVGVLRVIFITGRKLNAF